MGKYSKLAIRLLRLLERTSKKYRKFIREIDEKPHMAGMQEYNTIGLTGVAARKSMNGNINKELLNYVTNLKPSPTFFGELFYNVGTPELVATRFEYDPWQLYRLSRKQRDWLSMLQDASGSNISEAERLGIPKGERNFKPRWHVANYPGYLLKGLMAGSPLEKQLSKNGTININQLNAYLNKSSQLERGVVNKVLTELFAGQKFLDYNKFKKAVLDELITYERKPLIKYSDYGMDRIGYANDIKVINNFSAYMELLLHLFPNRFLQQDLVSFIDTETGQTVNMFNFHDYDNAIIAKLLKNRVTKNTFTFESPRLPVGNKKHYDTTTLGHSRTYTTPEEPNVLHVMESLSDWGQSKLPKYAGRNYLDIDESAFHFLNKVKRLFGHKYPRDTEQYIKLYTEGGHDAAANGEYSKNFVKDVIDKGAYLEKEANPQAIIRLTKWKDLLNASQREYLHDNYLQRQLQENLRYAAENGLTKMRYPTPESAVKIEGYFPAEQPDLKELPYGLIEELNTNRQVPTPYSLDIWDFKLKLENAIAKGDKNKINTILSQLKRALNIELRWLNGETTYSLEHEGILDKYSDFPNLFLKLYKDLQVRTVTDTKGNTWYEVDVPKNYLSSEWLFKEGGKPRIHIKPENRGKFTALKKRTGKSATWFKEHGTPALKKMATFALNSRHWNRHATGGRIFRRKSMLYT